MISCPLYSMYLSLVGWGWAKELPRAAVLVIIRTVWEWLMSLPT